MSYVCILKTEGVTDMKYAIVDAEGAFDSAGRGKSWVHRVYDTSEAAIKAAKRMRQVQVICGALQKGDLVYQDALGHVYPRIQY